MTPERLAELIERFKDRPEMVAALQRQLDEMLGKQQPLAQDKISADPEVERDRANLSMYDEAPKPTPTYKNAVDAATEYTVNRAVNNPQPVEYPVQGTYYPDDSYRQRAMEIEAEEMGNAGYITADDPYKVVQQPIAQTGPQWGPPANVPTLINSATAAPQQSEYGGVGGDFGQTKKRFENLPETALLNSNGYTPEEIAASKAAAASRRSGIGNFFKNFGSGKPWFDPEYIQRTKRY